MKSVQNMSFCNVFNALASENLSEYRYFFSLFAGFCIAGSLPKWPKIPCQYPLKLRHPRMVEKSRAIRGPGCQGPRVSPSMRSFQCVLFSLFHPAGASQAREFQIATTTMPRKTVQTTFSTVTDMVFFQQNRPSPFSFRCPTLVWQIFCTRHFIVWM